MPRNTMSNYQMNTTRLYAISTLKRRSLTKGKNHDLEPFFGLHPTKLQKLSQEVAGQSGMYTISCPGTNPKSTKGKGSKCAYSIVEKGLNAEGKRVARERAKAQLSLLEEVQMDLEEVAAVFYSHDVPWQFVGHEYVCPSSSYPMSPH